MDRILTLGGTEEEEDDATLDCWRVFALLSLQGDVNNVDFLECRPFVKFVNDLGLRAGASGSALDQAALQVIFQTHARGMMAGQRRKSMTARIFESERVSAAGESTQGKKLSFECFCAAMHAVGARAFAEDGALCLARLLQERVLPRWHADPGRALPHAIDPAAAQSFASEAAVVAVVQDFAEELHKIFEHACGVRTAGAGMAMAAVDHKHAGAAHVIRYEQYQEFCASFLYFSTRGSSARPLLTKYDLGQIFTFVCGDVRGPAGLLFHEFLMALSVIAFCALAGLQHAGAAGGGGALLGGAAAPSSVARIKWLLHRLYNSPQRTSAKLPQMAPFCRKFAGAYRSDGAPDSYLGDLHGPVTGGGGGGGGGGGSNGAGGGASPLKRQQQGSNDSALGGGSAAVASSSSSSSGGGGGGGGRQRDEQEGASAEAQMPAHIEREFDEASGQYYYVNIRTEQTAWSLGEALEQDAAAPPDAPADGSPPSHAREEGGAPTELARLRAGDFFDMASTMMIDADAQELWQKLCEVTGSYRD